MEDNRITDMAQEPLLRLTDAERRDMLRLLEEGKLPYEVDRRDDRFFKFLLGRRVRSPLLMDLLNCILVSVEHPRVVSLAIENSELYPEGRDLKLSRLDIHATDENGHRQIIELQKRKHSFFVEREIFYWAKDFSEQLEKGGKYSDLKPTISISLMGFNLFSKDSRAIWDFMLMNPKTGKILSRHEVLTFVELPKFEAVLATLLKKVRTGEVLTEEDRLGVWSGYFSDTDMGVEIVQEMAEKDTIFQELRNSEKDYWQRPEARYFLLRERLTEMDRMAEIDDAIAEARAEGEYNKSLEIAMDFHGAIMP
jgi:predicted transposase/invertase (TIGR01784 family)